MSNRLKFNIEIDTGKCAILIEGKGRKFGAKDMPLENMPGKIAEFVSCGIILELSDQLKKGGINGS